MNKSRIDLINQAFNKLDKDKDGINLIDLKFMDSIFYFLNKILRKN